MGNGAQDNKILIWRKEVVKVWLYLRLLSNNSLFIETLLLTLVNMPKARMQ